MLPSREIIIDYEKEYTGMPSLTDNDDSKEEVPPNEQVRLVVRKVLIAQVKEDETYRENLFCTPYHNKDKVHNLIIDRESCANIANSVMMEKLAHPTTDHPSLYKLQWFNNSGDVLVIQ